jgi:hypothetical protein
MRAALAVSGALGALLAAGSAAVWRFAQPTRDAWMLVGADADGAIAYVRLSVADTGFLDRQLTTRFALLPPSGNPVEHRAMNGPADLGPDGVAAGPDALVPTGTGWELRIGGEGLGARVQLHGAAAACPPVPGAMVGMVEDRSDGRLLSGPGIVLRTHASGHVEDAALYVLGEGFSAGIDPLSDCPAWVRAGDRTWTGDATATLADGDALLQLGSWTLGIRPAGTSVDQDAWAHALPAERWLARLFGNPSPHVMAKRVLVRVDGPGVGQLAPGLTLRRL